MNQTHTTPPWGYRQAIPLQKQHRVQLTETGMAPAFCHGLHAVPLSAQEFHVALRDYPIVFLRRAADGAFQAMAILGIQEGQNLFVMPDGRWDRRTYIPAYVRRYPFCMTTVRGKGTAARRVICVDPGAVNDAGTPLFDESGGALPHWGVIERLLNDYEDELARTEALGSALDRLGVLSPFSLHADLSSGFSLSLDGLYRVDRAKLSGADSSRIREMIAAGEMDWVYAHLLSQENFQRLLARRSFFSAAPAAARQQLN